MCPACCRCSRWKGLRNVTRNRFPIACAFAKRPDVLILDEPTSGLDGRNMRRIADALALLAGRGACVLVITHDLELMGLSCARALRLPLS